MEKLPPKLPKIDWDYYKRNVRTEYIPVVENFEEKYNKVTIPYPSGDKFYEKIQQIKAEVKVIVVFLMFRDKCFCVHSKERCGQVYSGIE